jgi:hypothetical protein
MQKTQVLLALLWIASTGVAQDAPISSAPPGLTTPLMGILVFVTIANLLLAFALFVVALLAYQRLKTRRLGLIGLAFGLFSLRWVMELLAQNMGELPGWTRPIGAILELLAFLVLLMVLFLE